MTNIKLLGIRIDNTLTWKPHIEMDHTEIKCGLFYG